MKAPKKADKKMAIGVESEADTKTRPVRLDLSPETHRLLRLVAADEEVSMAALARDAIDRFVRDEAKRRGIKG